MSFRALAGQHHAVTGGTSVPELWLDPSAVAEMLLSPKMSEEKPARPCLPGPQTDLLPIWQFLMV